MTTYRVSESCCPNCGKRCDCATNAIGKGNPEPNDITICWGCGEILKLDSDLKLCTLNMLELIELQRSAEWPKIERIVKHIHGPQS